MAPTDRKAIKRLVTVAPDAELEPEPAPTPLAPQRPVSRATRAWRRMRGHERFVFPLPSLPLATAQALQDELAKTFTTHKVRYHAESNEMVINAKADTAKRTIVRPRAASPPPPAAQLSRVNTAPQSASQ